MSVTEHLSHIEMAFGLGALAMTLFVGVVLWPAMRRALQDKDRDRRGGAP